MKKQHLIPIFCLLAVLLCTTTAHALSPPPPQEIDLGDGLVFHITPSHYEEQGYPTTGLYRAGAAIYTINRQSFGALFFSQDAMSFLEIPREWHGTHTAIRFYQQGLLVHLYYVQDLLTDDGESLSVDYIHLLGWIGSAWWDTWNGTDYNRANNTLQITTIEGSQITFDLSSGRITDLLWVEQRLLGSNHAIIVAIGSSLSVVIGIVVLRAKYLRTKQNMNQKNAN